MRYRLYGLLIVKSTGFKHFLISEEIRTFIRTQEPLTVERLLYNWTTSFRTVYVLLQRMDPLVYIHNTPVIWLFDNAMEWVFFIFFFVKRLTKWGVSILDEFDFDLITLSPFICNLILKSSKNLVSTRLLELPQEVSCVNCTIKVKVIIVTFTNYHAFDMTLFLNRFISKFFPSFCIIAINQVEISFMCILR